LKRENKPANKTLGLIAARFAAPAELFIGAAE